MASDHFSGSKTGISYAFQFLKNKNFFPVFINNFLCLKETQIQVKIMEETFLSESALYNLFQVPNPSPDLANISGLILGSSSRNNLDLQETLELCLVVTALSELSN